MSLSSRRSLDPTQEEPKTDAQVAPAETVLELLDDQYARRILMLLQEQPRCARELTEACQTSRTTIYRRLKRLEAAGLVESTMTVHPDGHHRKTFAAAFDEITLTLSSGELVTDLPV